MSSPPSDLINRSKTRVERSPGTMALWALTILISLIFIAAAVPKLGSFGFFGDLFERWGYPDWLEMGVGIIEFVAAIFLIIPSTAFFAACTLAAIMVGAIITHLALGTALNALIPLAMLGALLYIAWVRRPQAAHTEQPSVP